jgi:hypothetical protein
MSRSFDTFGHCGSGRVADAFPVQPAQVGQASVVLDAAAAQVERYWWEGAFWSVHYSPCRRVDSRARPAYGVNVHRCAAC